MGNEGLVRCVGLGARSVFTMRHWYTHVFPVSRYALADLQSHVNPRFVHSRFVNRQSPKPPQPRAIYLPNSYPDNWEIRIILRTSTTATSTASIPPPQTERYACYNPKYLPGSRRPSNNVHPPYSHSAEAAPGLSSQVPLSREQTCVSSVHHSIGQRPGRLLLLYLAPPRRHETQVEKDQGRIFPPRATL